MIDYEQLQPSVVSQLIMKMLFDNKSTHTKRNTVSCSRPIISVYCAKDISLYFVVVHPVPPCNITC